jgi:protein-tyrosine phosphatase
MQTDIFTVPDLPNNTKLSIMAHPRGDDWLEDEIKALHEVGVTVLVSLLERSEILELHLTAEAALCAANSLEYLNFPIADNNVPSLHPTTLDFLRGLKTSLEQNQHVVVHCRMGLGRSGLVAACLLIMVGLSPEQALLKLSELRGLDVPDTIEQREWVFDFARYWQAQAKTG